MKIGRRLNLQHKLVVMVTATIAVWPIYAREIVAESRDLVRTMNRVKSHPGVVRALGRSGRILEVVLFDGGAMLRYSQGKDECVGRVLLAGSTGEADEFYADDRCAAFTGEAFNFDLRTAPAQRDFSRMMSAIHFSTRLFAVSPPIDRLIGIREEGRRMIVTYRPLNAKPATCWLSVEPLYARNEGAVGPWRLSAPIACAAQ